MNMPIINESRKIMKLFDFLRNYTRENMTHGLRSLHASILFSGNKIISYGHNNINHEGVLGKQTKSEHAEVAACHFYSKLHLHKHMHKHNHPPKKSCLL